MNLPLDFTQIRSHCLFCDPKAQAQENQVVLRTDNFYLFAGIGAIVEGYIIIVPKTCDWTRGGLKTMSEACAALIDEILYLRGIISKFYRDTYETEESLCFEHGRAGTCGVSDTPHCYHAHLCCFPGALPIWRKIDHPRPIKISSFGDLGSAVGKSPYLLIQNCVVNRSVLPDVGGRTEWENRVVVLNSEQSIPRQYLRRLLAEQVGDPDAWDWAAVPRPATVEALRTKFREWLCGSGLPVEWSAGEAPRMRFLEGVRTSTSQAYDRLAPDYHKLWKDPSPAMAETARQFAGYVRGRRTRGVPKVLDVGCGSGIYTELLSQYGFQCTGIDISEGMLAAAIAHLENSKANGQALDVEFWQRDAFGLHDFESGRFDAIWCCAVAVHLPRRYAQRVFGELRRMISASGIVYISAQLGGDAILRNEGRFFVYYCEEELEAYFRSAGLAVLKRWHDTTDKGSLGDTRAKSWVHYFLAPEADKTP